jgi:hypothetical protein
VMSPSSSSPGCFCEDMMVTGEGAAESPCST